MSNYPTAPPPPPSESQGRPTPTEPPPAIKTSVNIVWALVALSVLSTILTFVYIDDIAEASGSNLTSAELDTARTAAVAAGIIGFLIFGALWVLLAVFLRKGANWARIVLTVLTALGVAFGLFGLVSGGQPAVFAILGVVNLILSIALLVFMWRQESTDYIKASAAR